MIEKQVIFEGILREEEEQSNDTARLQDYRVAATGFLLMPTLL